jgi:hypothetical protein
MHINRNLWLVILVVFSFNYLQIAHSQELIKNKKTEKSMIPRYDAGLGQFTDQPVMLKTQVAKHVAQSIAARSLTLSGENIDLFVDELNQSIPQELHPLVAYYATVEFAKTGCKFDFYTDNNPRESEPTHKKWLFYCNLSSELKELKTLNITHTKKEKYNQKIIFDHPITGILYSPRQKIIITKISGPIAIFLMRNNRCWEIIDERPYFESEIWSFLDDETIVVLAHTEPLKSYSLNYNQLLSKFDHKSLPIAQPISDFKKHDHHPLIFLLDENGTLSVFYKHDTTAMIKEIRKDLKPKRFDQIISSNDKIITGISFEKSRSIILLSYLNELPLFVKALSEDFHWITSLEDGHITLEYFHDDTTEYTTYNVDTNTFIGFLLIKNSYKHWTNVPLNVLLASVALQHSQTQDNSSTLQKLKESKTLQQLPAKFKSKLLKSL